MHRALRLPYLKMPMIDENQARVQKRTQEYNRYAIFREISRVRPKVEFEKQISLLGDQ